jgi:hypothetical protein
MADAKLNRVIFTCGGTAGHINPAIALAQRIAAENPQAEFVLIATTIPNEETLLMRSRPRAEGEDPTCEDHRSFNNGRHDEFLPMLQALKAEHVALTDMTTMHHYLLSLKPFRDMTGNNVNHPNDFLARMYAQMVLGTLQ